MSQITDFAPFKRKGERHNAFTTPHIPHPLPRMAKHKQGVGGCVWVCVILWLYGYLHLKHGKQHKVA